MNFVTDNTIKETSLSETDIQSLIGRLPVKSRSRDRMSSSAVLATQLLDDAMIGKLVLCPENYDEEDKESVERMFCPSFVQKNDARIPMTRPDLFVLVKIELEFETPPSSGTQAVFVSVPNHDRMHPKEREQIENRFGLQPVDNNRRQWIWHGCMPMFRELFLYIGESQAVGMFKMTVFYRRIGYMSGSNLRKALGVSDYGIENMLRQGKLPFSIRIPTTLDGDTQWRAELAEAATQRQDAERKRQQEFVPRGEFEAALRERDDKIGKLMAEMDSLRNRLKQARLVL